MKPFTLITTFEEYTVHEVIGEGGSGRVFAAADSEGSSVAVKMLTLQASREKRRRFKNEIGFQSRTEHPNIVRIIDRGVRGEGETANPFYVMPRYRGSLRTLLSSANPPAEILRLFKMMMDGVEAAHLLGVTHRDLKPENVLLDEKRNLALADFGIARFVKDALETQIETKPAQRLANFEYAAPEQRRARHGMTVDERADIYALGLMLNEMFTQTVPHGTSYQQIAAVTPDYGFLDPIVAKMLSQNPADRPQDVAEVRRLIGRHQDEYISGQKLSRIKGTVIAEEGIDDPLAFTPPRVVDADWNDGRLTLVLDKPVSSDWARVLREGRFNHNSFEHTPTSAFSFTGREVFINAHIDERHVLPVVSYFRSWLLPATHKLKMELEENARAKAHALRQQNAKEREREEARQRVLSSLRF